MEKVSISSLFSVFAKVGAFTIGGGYAMIPLIEDELLRRGWISREELGDMIVLAQSAPGILAVNMAIYTGHRLRGVKGSIAATVGAVLPSFVIILAIAMFFTSFGENEWVRRFMQGIRPVAVALILVPAVRMAQKSCRSWWAWATALLTLLAVALLKVSPIWIIITLASGAWAVSAIREERKK